MFFIPLQILFNNSSKLDVFLYMFKVLHPILYLVTLLPLRLLYLISDLIYPVVYYLVQYRRKVVRTNLVNSFPEKPLAEIIRIEKKFYHHFCDLFIESVYAFNMSKAEMDKHVVFNNLDTIEKQYDTTNVGMIMMAHFANWEWISSFSSHFEPEKPLRSVYKQLRNKDIDDLMYKLRTKYGGKNIEMRNLVKYMLHTTKTGEKGMILMIGDQRPKRSDNRFEMEFMNQPTTVLLGTEVLARKFNYPVLYCSIDKLGRGRYSYSFDVISDNPQSETEFAITQKYMQRLEADIHRRPELWLWSHDRWKFNNERR